MAALRNFAITLCVSPDYFGLIAYFLVASPKIISIF